MTGTPGEQEKPLKPSLAPAVRVTVLVLLVIAAAYGAQRRWPDQAVLIDAAASAMVVVYFFWIAVKDDRARQRQASKGNGS
jgi:hypothetical protein